MKSILTITWIYIFLTKSGAKMSTRNQEINPNLPESHLKPEHMVQNNQTAKNVTGIKLETRSFTGLKQPSLQENANIDYFNKVPVLKYPTEKKPLPVNLPPLVEPGWVGYWRKQYPSIPEMQWQDYLDEEEDPTLLSSSRWYDYWTRYQVPRPRYPPFYGEQYLGVPDQPPNRFLPTNPQVQPQMSMNPIPYYEG